MGDIGPIRRKIDFEPFPETAPIEEPSPSLPAAPPASDPAPSKPVEEPVPVQVRDDIWEGSGFGQGLSDI